MTTKKTKNTICLLSPIETKNILDKARKIFKDFHNTSSDTNKHKKRKRNILKSPVPLKKRKVVDLSLPVTFQTKNYIFRCKCNCLNMKHHRAKYAKMNR